MWHIGERISACDRWLNTTHFVYILIISRCRYRCLTHTHARVPMHLHFTLNSKVTNHLNANCVNSLYAHRMLSMRQGLIWAFKQKINIRQSKQFRNNILICAVRAHKDTIYMMYNIGWIPRQQSISQRLRQDENGWNGAICDSNNNKCDGILSVFTSKCCEWKKLELEIGKFIGKSILIRR